MAPRPSVLPYAAARAISVLPPAFFAGDPVMSFIEGKWYPNKHDARYEFRIVRDKLSIVVEQKAPKDAIVWLPGVWGQWIQSKTAVQRSQSMMDKYAKARPETKWFREHAHCFV